MSELVDKVAEAIALAGNGGTWDDWYNPEQKQFHRKRARAAIAVIREHFADISLNYAAAELNEELV